MTDKKYDVALSFAGEDRDYVEEVADHLKTRNISVFYDNFETADLWGKNLYTHLSDLYRNQAKYTVMFISEHYNKKVWCNHEREAAQSRAIEENEEYILPARFDDTQVPGVLKTTGFVDLRNHSPVELAVLLCEKLGHDQHAQKTDAIPPPKNPALSGQVRFNYSNNNGIHVIGDGVYEFTTKWSKASNKSIHCYNDPIRGLALVPEGISINEIPPIEELDFSSRSRKPNIDSLVVLQNRKGMFAVLQILEILDNTRGDDEDILSFKFWINEDGASDFSECAP